MRTSRAIQAAVITEQRQRGESARNFCNRKGLSLATFNRWKKNAGVWTDDAEPVPFVPVAIIDRQPVQEEATCVIRVGRNIAIECGADTHPTAIEHALKAALLACGQN